MVLSQNQLIVRQVSDLLPYDVPRLICGAALFLHSRSYQGLEAKIGEDSPSVLEQGRSGIARGYSDDHS